MTDEEQGEQLLKEAKEISFQMDVCVKDIDWIGEKIRALDKKVTEAPFEEREAAIKELGFLTKKLEINIAARQAIKQKSQELGVRVNQFFGHKVWGELS